MRKGYETYIACDCCGKEVVITSDEESYIQSAKSANYFELIMLDQGYGSVFDGQNIEFDVCGDCLKTWFSGFKNVPKGCISFR